VVVVVVAPGVVVVVDAAAFGRVLTAVLGVVACAGPALGFPVVGVADEPAEVVVGVGVDPDPDEDCAGGISVDALQICA
jgi:hypothetical protein